MFRDKFWITLLLSVPTLAWSDMARMWFGFTAPTFPGSLYIPVIFGTAVYVYGGSVFLIGGIRELRDRLPGMMTLISLAISVAFVFSLAVTLGYPGESLWWELASLVTIMLLGHWIEMRSIFQAQGAVRELARLLPSTAQRIVGERIEEVPISALGEGDLVLVRPGASIPADGVVRSGKSGVNESMITGESVPVEKTEGGKVIAGTVNGAGSLRVEVTGTGEHQLAVFADPQVASAGATEDDLRRTGQPYLASRRAYGDAAFGWALEDTTSFVKLLADPATRLLLGAHIIGPDASVLIQPLVQAMCLGNTVDEVARGVLYIHPALTEVVEQALLKL